MAGTTFRDSVFAISPSFLRGPVGERLLYSMAIQLDALADSAIEGVKARWPGVGSEEALPFIGRDRQIDRGPNETTSSYVGRLRGAFDTWRTAGNARSVLSQLAAYFQPLSLTLRTVSNSSVWDSLIAGVFSHLQASPANWNWDGLPQWWRAWVIVYSPSGMPWSFEGDWGDPGVWGEVGTWTTTASASEISSIRAFIRKWKAAHAWVPWIIVSLDPALFDPSDALGDPGLPDGNWGGWSKVIGGVQVPSRAADAAYWDGVI